MKRVQIEFTDFRTGAASPIDIVNVPDDYTEKDYINDCKKYADNDYNKMLRGGKVTFITIMEYDKLDILKY